MEQYRLIFAGQRCGDYAKLPLEQHLKLLKLSDRATAKMLGGAKVSLKSGLSREQATRQQALFEKRGLVTYHQLQLSPEIFAHCLQENHIESGSVDPSLPVYELSDNVVLPSFFRRPGLDSMGGEKHKEQVSVESKNYQFNGLLLIVAGAGMGLVLQSYLVVLAKTLGFPNIVATVSGVLFLFACVLMLPRLLQPLLELEVRFGDSLIQLYEQPQLSLGRKRIIWETNDALGEFVVGTDKAEAASVASMYEWSAHHHLDGTSEATIREIQDAITDGTVIDVAGSLYEKLKPLLMRLLPRGGDKMEVDWLQEPASVVCDSNEEVVALIYQGNHCAYQIIRNGLVSDPVLHAFCLSIHRAGLV